MHVIFGWGSPRFQRFVVDILPWPALHDLRDKADMLHEKSTEIFKAAKRALAANEGKDAVGRIGGGKDIISTLSQYRHPSIVLRSLPIRF